MRNLLNCNYAIAALLLAVCAFTNCSASTCKRAKPEAANAEADSLFAKSFADSITTVILESKDFTAILLPTPNDSLSGKTMKLKTVDKEIFKFIISDGKNYESDEIVYGITRPSLKVIVKNKKTSLQLGFDLGLRKWLICDEKGDTLKQYDIKTDDMLRFAHRLFPEDTLFNELIKLNLK